MIIAFDERKSNKNNEERKLPFHLAKHFNFESASYAEDDRKAYGEQRIIAIGYLGMRLHVLCFTPINGGIRIISFRKANSREVRRYEKEIINQ